MESTSPATSLAPFPPGVFWESLPGGGGGALQDYTRFSPSRRAVTAETRVDSRGHLAALKYKTKSGKSLATAADGDEELDV